MQTVKVKQLHPLAKKPEYKTAGAACFDLCAIDGGTLPQGVEREKYPGPSNVVPHNMPVVYRTGLAFEIPPGWAMLIYSRSGQGFNNSTRLANCVGVIDSDYRGEVMVKLTRDGSIDPLLEVNPGDRIAQAMLVPAAQVQLEIVDELSATDRGTGGFGSTGKQ